MSTFNTCYGLQEVYVVVIFDQEGNFLHVSAVLRDRREALLRKCVEEAMGFKADVIESHIE